MNLWLISPFSFDQNYATLKDCSGAESFSGVSVTCSRSSGAKLASEKSLKEGRGEGGGGRKWTEREREKCQSGVSGVGVQKYSLLSVNNISASLSIVANTSCTIHRFLQFELTTKKNINTVISAHLKLLKRRWSSAGWWMNHQDGRV